MKTPTQLKNMKENIEKMSKVHQVAILGIFSKNDKIVLNENKSGIFINLSVVPESVIDEVIKYIEYVSKQESQLNSGEKEKERYKQTFFNENVSVHIV